MTSLIQDCQAWIDKGQEFWKSYFSKWETFAEYEESLPESELIHELSDKSKERKNGSQKLLKLPLAKKRLKRVFFKNQQRKQKKLIKKKKSCQKVEAETRSHGDESLVEILENKHLGITLMTFCSEILKANTNKYELLAILFQTFTGREVTVKDSDHLLPRHQEALPYSDFERSVANLSLENQRVLSVSMPGNNLSLENQRVLSVSMAGNNLSLENQKVFSVSKLRSSFSGRSVCPPRNVYLQNLNEKVQERNSEPMQSNSRQCQNLRVRAQATNIVSRNTLSKHQSSTSDGSQTPILEKRSNLLYNPDLFRNKSSKSVEFDSNHKFPKGFYQNKEFIRGATISEFSRFQEGRRLGNLSLQHRTNRIILSMDNANFIRAQKRLSEHKCLSKMPSQKRHSSKKLISDSKESDSDSDDQTKYHSPFIHGQNKRLKADEQIVDTLEPHADDCQHIFDRVMKS